MCRLLMLVLILGACASKSSMKKLDPYIFLHDNSSKVWLVNRQLINQRNYTPLRLPYKDLVIFHSTRNCYFKKVKDFDQPGKKASFWLDMETRTFGFDGGNQNWKFQIYYLSRNQIILKPLDKTYPFTLELIPFPEY